VVGADAIQDCFSYLDGACFGASIAKVFNCVAADGDAGSFEIGFGGALHADNTCMCNIGDLIFWYLLEHDWAHGVGSFDALELWRVGQSWP